MNNKKKTEKKLKEAFVKFDNFRDTNIHLMCIQIILNVSADSNKPYQHLIHRLTVLILFILNWGLNWAQSLVSLKTLHRWYYEAVSIAYSNWPIHGYVYVLYQLINEQLIIANWSPYGQTNFITPSGQNNVKGRLSILLICYNLMLKFVSNAVNWILNFKHSSWQYYLFLIRKNIKFKWYKCSAHSFWECYMATFHSWVPNLCDYSEIKVHPNKSICLKYMEVYKYSKCSSL